jgi:hypothetical protein
MGEVPLASRALAGSGTARAVAEVLRRATPAMALTMMEWSVRDIDLQDQGGKFIPEVVRSDVWHQTYPSMLEWTRAQYTPNEGCHVLYTTCLPSIPVVSVAAFVIVQENTSSRSCAKDQLHIGSCPDVLDNTNAQSIILVLRARVWNQWCTCYLASTICLPSNMVSSV